MNHDGYYKPLSVREAERLGDRRKVRAWKRLNWRERIALRIAPWLIGQENRVSLATPTARGSFFNPRTYPCTHGKHYNCASCDRKVVEQLYAEDGDK